MLTPCSLRLPLSSPLHRSCLWPAPTVPEFSGALECDTPLPACLPAMSESKQQDSSNTPQKLPPAVSSSSSTPAQSSASKAQQAKGAHLTPLKVASSDKNLDVDDTLFTESFVRKLSPRSNEACRLLGVLPDELVLRSHSSSTAARRSGQHG